MRIEFEDERELVNAIAESNVDIYTFAVLFLDRFGVMLNDARQGKLLSAQEKRKNEEREYAEWAKKQDRILTLSDIFADDAIGEAESADEIKREVRKMLGEIKWGSIWHKDVRKLRGKYYFNDGGAQMVTYRLYHIGRYDEETLHRIRKRIGIDY